MSQKFLSGGQGRIDIFRLDASNDDALVIKDAAFTAAATDVTDVAYTLSVTEQTQIQPQDDGSVNIAITNYEDTPELTEFLEKVTPDPTTLTGAPEFKLENGQKCGASAGKDRQVVLIHYGPAQGSTAGTDKMKVTIAVGGFKATSGTSTSKADEWSKPTIEFAGIKCSSLLTVAKTLFAETAMGITAEQHVFKKNECHKTKWFARA